MHEPADAKHDPIQESPLRDPGQSLREQLLDSIVDRLLFWIIATVMTATFAVFEWLRWLVGMPVIPIPMSLLAIVIGAIGVWRWRSLRRNLQQLKLGLRGERAVGQFLQGALIPLGYRVFHDVCFADYNIDHALIGPGGVFAVEVKTRMKPRRRRAEVTYDGTQVTVDGFVPDRDPVVQARAAASSLQRILEQRSGRKVSVRPVVLYAGWWVHPQPRGVETWVLNEKRFIAFVEREPQSLSPADVQVLADALARHIREQVDG